MASRYTWLLYADCSYESVTGVELISDSNNNNSPIIKLRRGGSVEPIVGGFINSQTIQVTGPPGCGKSTTVPAKLASAMNTLIVHLVPHPMQALELRAGLSGAELISDYGAIFKMPMKPGVLIMSYTTLVSLTIRLGKTFHDIDPGIVLYCDESHESDAATYSFVQFAGSKFCKNRVAFVSATLDGQEFAVEETRVPVTDILFDCSSLNSVANECVAVAAGRKQYKVLYFDDSSERRAKAVALFASRGYAAGELHSKSEPDDYKAMVRYNKEAPFWFCAADSSYRTGFNFDLDCVFDTCKVAYRSTRDGTVQFRHAFNFESYQAKGRLGRSDYVNDPVYYRSVPKGEDLLARIEGAEMLIANMVMRSQGFINKSLESVGPKGDKFLLKDFSDLGGPRLISQLPPEAFVSANDIKAKRIAAKAAKDDSKLISSRAAASLDVADLFENLMSKAPQILISDKVGYYYCIVGNMQIKDKSPGFPGGRRSVLDCVRNGRLATMLSSLPTLDAELVAKVLITEMTNASVKSNAVLKLLLDLTHNCVAINSAQRRYLESIHDDMGQTGNAYRYMAGLLSKLQGFAELEIVELPSSDFACFVDELFANLSTELGMLRNDYKTVIRPSITHIHSGMFPRGNQPRIVDRKERIAIESAAPADDNKASSSSGSSSRSFWSTGAKTYDARSGRFYDPRA